MIYDSQFQFHKSASRIF